MSKIKTIFAISIVLITTQACNVLASSVPTSTVSTVTAVPTNTAMAPIPTATAGKILITEADIPRVTVDDAKAALESGKAIIVDVRSRQAYDMSHIKSAVYIPLADIETNPTGLNLDKTQWIIPYCS